MIALRVRGADILPGDRLYVNGRDGGIVDKVDHYPHRVFAGGWMLDPDARYHVRRSLAAALADGRRLAGYDLEAVGL